MPEIVKWGNNPMVLARQEVIEAARKLSGLVPASKNQLVPSPFEDAVTRLHKALAAFDTIEYGHALAEPSREWPSTGLEEAPWLSRQNQQDLLDCLRDVLILGDRLDVDQVRAAIAMLESKPR